MVTIGPLVAEIFEFENVYGRTHGRWIDWYTISSPWSQLKSEYKQKNIHISLYKQVENGATDTMHKVHKGARTLLVKNCPEKWLK